MIGANSGERGMVAARTVAKLAGDSGSGPWLYQFAYVPEFRSKEWANGAIHSAELLFSFDSPDTSSWTLSEGGKVDEKDRACRRFVNRSSSAQPARCRRLRSNCSPVSRCVKRA